MSRHFTKMEIGSGLLRGPAGFALWIGLGLGALLLGACTQAPPESPPPSEPSATVTPRAKTTEFVVLIDNSASIRPPEQVIIREATMLLGDLADRGDRISVIGFGENARLVTSMLFQGDADRKAFKDAIRQGLHFQEKLSDIRAGIRLLAERRDALFPTPTATHAAVLFSDGLLEPRNTPAPEALRQMLADLQDPLAKIEKYAVVLGDTTSRRPIPGLAPPLTGYELLKQRVASAPESFYQARQLEQLPEVAVTILNKTKGISSLGEASGTAFRSDQTVRAMTLIVRKRPPDAPANSDLPTAQQIQLHPPEAAATPEESIYRSGDYQHFELFVARRPRPGLWRVTRDDGKPPIVLSKIDSPVALQWQAKSRYAPNEAAGLRAWLWDEITQGVVKDDYQFQAHIAPVGGLADSQIYRTMTPDDQGQAVLVVPAAFGEALGTALPAGQSLEVEIIAQNPHDPWFLRRSPPLVIELSTPFIDWFQPDAVTRTLLFQSVPLLGRTLSFTLGGQTLAAEYAKVGFEAPPELTVAVERFDDKTHQYGSYFEGKISAATENQALVFRTPLAVNDYGAYRYRYRLTGHTATGPVTIQSPWYSLRIEFFWELAIPLGILLLAAIEILSRWTARLKGQIQIEKTGPHPGFDTIAVRPSRCVTVPIAPDDLVLRVCAQRRYLFLSKRLCIRLTGAHAVLDGRPLAPGETTCVPARGIPTLNFPQGGGAVTVQMMLQV